MLQVPSAPCLTTQESQSPPLPPLPSQPTVGSHMSAHFPPSPTLSCLEPSANLTSKALITHTHSHLFFFRPAGGTYICGTSFRKLGHLHPNGWSRWLWSFSHHTAMQTLGRGIRGSLLPQSFQGGVLYEEFRRKLQVITFLSSKESQPFSLPVWARPRAGRQLPEVTQ